MKVNINGKKVDAKLPKEFKKKWIDALNSGDFKQSSGSLKDKYGYCCLGVACKIANPNMRLTGKGLISKGNFPKSINKIEVPDIIKGEVDKYSKDYNPIVNKLATYNDNGKSFNWIASYIERYL